MYSLLCLAVLASLGASSLLQMRNAVWRVPVSMLIIIMLFFELRPSAWFAGKSLSIGNPGQISDAYSFLRTEKDRGGVVELPSKMDSGLATPFATKYAYGAASHLRGAIAFHGSMYPPVLESLRVVSHSLPAPDAIRMMQRHGVSRLVVHKDLMSVDSARSITAQLTAQGFPVIFATGSSTVFSLIRSRK
jgi:hypothetical protein